MGLNFRKKEGLVKRCLAPAVFAAAGFLGCGGGGGETTPVNEAPVLESSIDNQIWEGNTSPSNIINLNDYFSDPDSILNFFASGNSNINVNIDGSGNVSVSQPINWCGNEEITFTADDGEYFVDSNPIKFTVYSPGAGIDRSGSLEMLIVTESGLAAKFQELAVWKTRKGVITEVHVVPASYGGGRDRPEEIREYIKDMKGVTCWFRLCFVRWGY